MTGDNTSVLVVEDDRALADLYATWLNDRYDTEVVYSGADAQKRLRRGRYDVVLLDRLMPDISGDAVLETIREEDIDCHVAMVTAVSPDFDIIEMGFDSYVVKPVMADDLYEVVDRLHNLTTYERQVRRLYSLVEKRAVLEAEKTAYELVSSVEYADLKEKIAALRDESRASLRAVEDEDFRSLMEGISPTDEEEPVR